MIVARRIKEWSDFAPWKNLDMVEQDLIIEKALVKLYKQPLVAKNLAFKGGTALNKLFVTRLYGWEIHPTSIANIVSSYSILMIPFQVSK